MGEVLGGLNLPLLFVKHAGYLFDELTAVNAPDAVEEQIKLALKVKRDDLMNKIRSRAVTITAPAAVVVSAAIDDAVAAAIKKWYIMKKEGDMIKRKKIRPRERCWCDCCCCCCCCCWRRLNILIAKMKRTFEFDLTNKK